MARYYHPDEFADLKAIAAQGFVHVESGPLVRSSYHAHEQADAFDAHRLSVVNGPRSESLARSGVLAGGSRNRRGHHVPWDAGPGNGDDDGSRGSRIPWRRSFAPHRRGYS